MPAQMKSEKTTKKKLSKCIQIKVVTLKKWTLINVFVVISLFPFQNKFKELTHAYEILSNPEKRDLYDKGGIEAVNNGGMPGAGLF